MFKIGDRARFTRKWLKKVTETSHRYPRSKLEKMVLTVKKGGVLLRFEEIDGSWGEHVFEKVNETHFDEGMFEI